MNLHPSVTEPPCNRAILGRRLVNITMPRGHSRWKAWQNVIVLIDILNGCSRAHGPQRFLEPDHSYTPDHIRPTPAGRAIEVDMLLFRQERRQIRAPCPASPDQELWRL
jgi:hypothetical protein